MPLTNFSFVIPNVLAGCAHPQVAQTASEIVADKICGTIVNLTEHAYSAELSNVLCDGGVRIVHIPIEDFQAPSSQQFDQMRDIICSQEFPKPVLVHCRAGIGRTGTMLAAGVFFFLNSATNSADLDSHNNIENSIKQDLRSTIERFDLGPAGESKLVMYMRSVRKAALEVPIQYEAFHELENRQLV